MLLSFHFVIIPVMLLRAAIILSGFLVLMLHQYIRPVSAELQFILFLTGIVLVGIPHGAADFLIATQNAGRAKKTSPRYLFFINYLGRLFLFGLLIGISPILGILLFIVFAAYHFGETDLCRFKTDTIGGKLFVTSYGFIILGILLLHHYEEVEPLLLIIDPALKHDSFLAGLQQHRYTILSFTGIFFYACAFIYFLSTAVNSLHPGEFFLQFLCILVILYNLPLVLGFTFYFIVWHSVLSLRHIINYLKKDDTLSTAKIAKQISAYSLLAMTGIGILGAWGTNFLNNDTILLCIILGLAVLTAPHMQIMHDMYKAMRSKNKSGPEV